MRLIVLNDPPTTKLVYCVNLCSYLIIFLKHFLCRFLKTRKPGVLVPILPLSFFVGYQADFVYGSKIARVQGKIYPLLIFFDFI